MLRSLVGSEMCITDSSLGALATSLAIVSHLAVPHPTPRLDSTSRSSVPGLDLLERAVRALTVLAGGEADTDVFALVAESVASLLPLVERFGIATADQVEIATLAERLRAETANGGCFSVMPLVTWDVCWASSVQREAHARASAASRRRRHTVHARSRVRHRVVRMDELAASTVTVDFYQHSRANRSAPATRPHA